MAALSALRALASKHVAWDDNVTAGLADEVFETELKAALTRDRRAAGLDRRHSRPLRRPLDNLQVGRRRRGRAGGGRARR